MDTPCKPLLRDAAILRDVLTSSSSIKVEFDIDSYYCPHHPSNTAWYWQKTCKVCSYTLSSQRTKSGSIEYDLSKQVRSSSVPPFLDGTNNYHPDYRFARWPHVCVYSFSRFSQAPGNMSLTVPVSTKRERRHARASMKYPARFPRKGSDTNPCTFTGKILSIKRDGLCALVARHDTHKSDAWK